MAVGLFFVKLLDVIPTPVWWIILPFAVWTVYTTDHLVDGFKKRGESAIYRHQFHFLYRKLIIPVTILTGITAIIITLLFLNKQIIICGLFLSGFVLLYFLLVRYQESIRIRYIQKELFIAAIYLSGILLAPLTWNQQPLDYEQLLVIGILFLLAWTESVMISFFDFEADMADGLRSFSTFFGRHKTQKILMIVHFSISIIIIVLMVSIRDYIFIIALSIELVMNTMLLSLIMFPPFFYRSGRFRWIGESVFFMPAIIVLF